MELVFRRYRFQDSAVFVRCERVRDLEELRVMWARMGILRVVIWNIFREGGAHVIKNIIS